MSSRHRGRSARNCSISQSTTVDRCRPISLCGLRSAPSIRTAFPPYHPTSLFIGTGTSVGRLVLARRHHVASSRGPRFIRAVRRTQPDLICAQATGTIDAGWAIPTRRVITFGGPVLRVDVALPSPYVGKVRIKAKLLITLAWRHRGHQRLDQHRSSLTN